MQSVEILETGNGVFQTREKVDDLTYTVLTDAACIAKANGQYHVTTLEVLEALSCQADYPAPSLGLLPEEYTLLEKYSKITGRVDVPKIIASEIPWSAGLYQTVKQASAETDTKLTPSSLFRAVIRPGTGAHLVIDNMWSSLSDEGKTP